MTSIPVTKQDDTDTFADVTVDEFYSVGKILKQTRLEQKRSLPEVAKRLRISEEYLEDLEEGMLEGKIERVYILGFLSSYAEFLSLDAKDLVKLYLSQVSPQKKSKSLAVVAPVLDEGMPKKWMLCFASLCLALAVFGWMWWTPKEANRLQVEQADTLRLQQLEQEISVAKAPVAEPSKVAESSQIPVVPLSDFVLHDGETLAVLADAFSWIEVQDETGEVLFTGHLGPGQSKEIPAQAGLTLSTGNAGAIVLKAGDQMTEKLGGVGEVVSGLELKFHTTH